MANASTGGLISGAASGASTGALIGGVPGALIGGAIGGITGLISGSSSDAQFKNQQAWAKYNAQSQYNTDLYNIQSQLGITMMNAQLAIASGNYTAQQARIAARYNAEMITKTTAYNMELLENDLIRTWNDMGLDLEQITAFRARERGDIVAEQGASGTVIGVGSNAVVVQDQMTQESLDKTVVEFNAERQAADISNSIAQGKWEGQVAVTQTLWEGETEAFAAQYNAKIAAGSSAMTGIIQAGAGRYTAEQRFQTAGYADTQAQSQYSAQNTVNMMNGLFGAATSYGVGRYNRKVPGDPGSSLAVA